MLPHKPHNPKSANSVRQAPQKPRPGMAKIHEGGKRWPQPIPLFAPLPREGAELLDGLSEALHHVRPLSAAHRRSLPEDIARLSRLLTTERAGLARSYWTSPAAISAYLYYFLPWNLLRLTRLLSALPLPDPTRIAAHAGGQSTGQAATAGNEALLLDVGSGPLTLPLALWLAYPRWRSAPIRVLAVDLAPQPLELGKSLLETLGKMSGHPVWQVHTARAPLEQAARMATRLPGLSGARPWLVSAVNVLNELRSGKRGAHREQTEEGEISNGCREEKLSGFLTSLAPLAQGRESQAPALLFVEPGTRLGGTTVMHMRRLALEAGWNVLSPCPHGEGCPLLENAHSRTWCHFTFSSAGAPPWLEKLSTDAGLEKNALSLAPLLLGRPPDAHDRTEKNPARERHSSVPGEAARVISASFAVPGLPGRARYACSGQGLLLLENAETLASGDLLNVSIQPGRDRKSGARTAGPVRTEKQPGRKGPPQPVGLAAAETSGERRRTRAQKNAALPRQKKTSGKNPPQPRLPGEEGK